MPLSVRERRELVYLDTLLCREKLTHFIRSAWAIIEPGHGYVHGWHIDAMSEHLTAVLDGQLKNLIINIPPRSMKSITVSVMFPAWAWIKHPHLRWLFASYAASLSVRDSVKCRRIIESPWYQHRFGHLYQLTSDQNAKEKYENDKTGHRIATSVGGRSTGEGGDIIVCLPYESQVSTCQGPLPIGDAVKHKVGSVLAYDHELGMPAWAVVTNHEENGVRELWEVELTNGKTFRLTGDHQVFLGEQQLYCEARELRPGDALFGLRGQVIVRTVKATGERVSVYNLRVAKHRNYFADGILMHNCDDPHKISDGESDAVREHTVEWWDQEMSSRGNDPKKVAKIVVMQRLHERDLSGHLLQEIGGYEHLCLPAEYDPTRKCSTVLGWRDPREKEGELLWPDRFGKTEVDELKRHLGSQGAAGQLAQLPGPAEGNIVKSAWWRRYREVPSDLDYCVISIDLPFDKSSTSDMAAFQVWGIRKVDRFLLYALAERMSFTEQIATAKRLSKIGWPGGNSKLLSMITEVIVEKKANGAAMIDVLRPQIQSLHAWNPTGDKKSRAQAMAPAVENGNYFLPDNDVAMFHVKQFIHEWAIFPNGAHDDQVDAATQMHLRCKKRLTWDNLTVLGETRASTWDIMMDNA